MRRRRRAAVPVRGTVERTDDQGRRARMPGERGKPCPQATGGRAPQTALRREAGIVSQLPNAWESQRYNGHDGGEAAIREALKDPRERIRWHQAELAERIREAINSNAS